jgi:hypothetical protein
MQHWVDLQQYLLSHLPHLISDNLRVLIVNGDLQHSQMTYIIRVLLLDYQADPLLPMVLINRWLALKHRDQPELPQLKFSSEIIDKDTFDLEIDIPMTDKLVDDGTAYHICPPTYWDDDSMSFVQAEL